MVVDGVSLFKMDDRTNLTDSLTDKNSYCMLSIWPQ